MKKPKKIIKVKCKKKNEKQHEYDYDTLYDYICDFSKIKYQHERDREDSIIRQ